MKYLHIAFLSVLFCSCTGNAKQKEIVESPPGYDLSIPEKFLMQEDLDEISGIIYIPDQRLIYTLNDEEGKMYIVDLENKSSVRSFKFTKKGDFEDLCFDGQYWYTLKSNGKVLRVSQPFTDSFQVNEYEYPTKGDEYETIFFDPATKKTVILCKQCVSYPQGKIPAYYLDTTNSQFVFDPHYAPDTMALVNVVGKPGVTMKPSAAAIHPLTGELYIVSINDRLLIIMKEGQINAAFKLPKKIFRQPEGITFAPNGDMYISNEAGESIANILRFPYKPATAISTQPTP